MEEELHVLSLPVKKSLSFQGFLDKTGLITLLSTFTLLILAFIKQRTNSNKLVKLCQVLKREYSK